MVNGSDGIWPKFGSTANLKPAMAQPTQTPLGGGTGIPLVDHILTPGSSLNPQFLLIMDACFATLFCLLIALYFFTGGNIHLLVFTVIELALWASVKW